MPSTAQEQLFLELINEARMDPLGNAARFITSYSPAQSGADNINDALSFFGVNGTILQSQFAALVPRAPLAWNDDLGDAARQWNGVMIAENEQDHDFTGQPSLAARFTNQGYAASTGGENIFAYTQDVLQGHAALFIDWGNNPAGGGIQPGAGHRANIMDVDFREVGIGVTTAPADNPVDPPTGLPDVGPLVVTQDFGARQNSPAVFVLGVAFDDDIVNDNFYSLNEGVGGLMVALGAANATTSASGGYAFGTNATGLQNITLSGGGLASAVTVSATLVNGVNIKLDVMDGTTLRTSVSAVVSGPVTRVEGLGLTGLALTTGAGSQTLIGTRGHDTLTGGTGIDSMAGGLGNDTYVVDHASDVVSESSGTGSGTDLERSSVTDTLASNVENLTLTGTGAISGTGNASGNVVTGNSGANVLSGLGGNDTLNAGAGNDTLFGGIGNDILNGSTGVDTTSYIGATSAVTINLALAAVQNTGGHGNDTISGVENVTGSNFADTLAGTIGNNVLAGGNGNDILHGGAGNDVLNGGAGLDTASYATATAAVTVRLGTITAQPTVGAGNDTLTSVENATGSAFNDLLVGNASINSLSGGNGNDTLVGVAGNDILTGGNGNDLLRGQAGADNLAGGAGADRFDFDAVTETGLSAATRDIIVDFVRAQADRIDISGLDANLALAGNQAYTFIGAAAFSGTNATGQLRYDATTHLVLGSNDADTAAEFSVQVNGLASMLAADFVL